MGVTIHRGPRAGARGPGHNAVRKKHMAKIRTTPRSGKAGATVSLKTPYGQAERSLSVPRNPRSPAQQRVRSVLGNTAARWRALTDQQRAAWVTAAANVSSQPRLGQSGHLTGCQFFIKINCILAAVGQDAVATPPDRPSFSPNPVGALTITNAAGAITLQLKVSRTPASYIMVMGTAPCSPGILRPRRFTLLGALPAPASGLSDITDLYVAKYGVPPRGSRVFIRTCQVADGWQDEPKDTTAVVPAN